MALCSATRQYYLIIAAKCFKSEHSLKCITLAQTISTLLALYTLQITTTTRLLEAGRCHRLAIVSILELALKHEN